MNNVPLGVDVAMTAVDTGSRDVGVLVTLGVIVANSVALGVSALVAASAVTVIAAAVYASGVAA
jgi:hypothetical protein